MISDQGTPLIARADVSPSTVNFVQSLRLNGVSGSFLVTAGGQASFTLATGDDAVTVRNSLIAALRTVPGLGNVGNKDVVVTLVGNSYSILYQGMLAGSMGTGLTLSVESASTVTQLSAMVTALKINAVAGMFRISAGAGRITSPLAYNASAAEVTAVLNALLNSTQVQVTKAGTTYTVDLSNVSGGSSIALSIDARNLVQPIVANVRTSGINYYNIATLNIDTGGANDVLNVRGTSAVTNLFLHNGDDRIYVSSLADQNLVVPGTDFLQGDLDQIRGALNIDAGSGRHLLMISDEAAISGDANVLITKNGASNAPGLPGAELLISGLAPARITYQAAASNGNFADGITIWTGWGNDSITIEGTQSRSNLRTNTTLNTGLGNDSVTVRLDAQTDGFFVLNTQGPYNDYVNLPDNDIVDASLSSLPLVIFGGQGSDQITGGTGNDIIFGDRGRVQYFLLSGQLTAALGAGGPGDKTEGAIRPVGLVFTVDPGVGGDDTVNAGLGNDLVLGGNSGALGDSIDAGQGNNIVIGDHGRITYLANKLRRIESTDPGAGGHDSILTGDGLDSVVAGPGDDMVLTGNGAKIVIGDNGTIDYDLTDANPATLDQVRSTYPIFGGGNDTITTGDSDDLIIGGDNNATGSNRDVINAGIGNNIVLADNGEINLSLALITSIRSTEPLQGGNDVVNTGPGDDIVIGGQGGDTINAGAGRNVVLGDSGQITAALSNQPNFGALPITIGRVETTAPGIGGIDSITTGTGTDLILGGAAGDTITANDGETAALLDANNIVIGDAGYIDFVIDDQAPATIDRVATSDAAIGGCDTIVTGAGNDLVLGGALADVISTGAGNDLAFGDYGLIRGIVAPNQLPLAMPLKPFVFTSIFTAASDLGGNDVIHGNSGDDIVD